MSGESINSYLSVVSFGLLGFDTDAYKSRYPGIAMELLAVSSNSFDKENEPLLLCAVHFLLSSLDTEEFTADIQNCWPYLDHKMKSEFKHAVYRSLKRLQMRKAANFDDQLSADFWTCHLAIHGEEVWLLLRVLTDICLDHAIDTLKPMNYAAVCTQSILTDPVGNAALQPAANGDISGVNPSAPVRRKSVVQLQTEAMQGISRVGSFLVRHPPAHSNSQEASAAARTQLLLFIGEEQRKVEELITLGIAKHNRICDYMQELEERLKIAKASLAHSQKQLRSAGGQKESVFALTEAGRQLRVTKLEKISAALILLEDLAASPLLAQTSTRLAEENTTTSAESSNKAENSSLGSTAGRGASLEGSRDRGNGERDFESKVEAGKQELLQQASLVYAIEALVNSLHEMEYQPLPALRTKLNKDVPPTVVEHLNYLWKASASTLPSAASIPAMHRLSKSFIDIAREHKVDLPVNVTERLCGFCSVVLIPSFTCHVRLRSRSRRSKVNRVGKEHLKNQLVMHCNMCEHTSKVPGYIRRNKDAVKVPAGAIPVTNKTAPSSIKPGLAPSNSSSNLAPPEKKKFSFLHKSQSADNLSQRRLSAPGKLDGDFVSFSTAGLNSQLSQANHSSLQSLSKGVFAGGKRDAAHMSTSASTGSLNLLELEALNKKKKRKSMGPTNS